MASHAHAAGPPVITDDELSVFRYQAQISMPKFAVPSVVDLDVSDLEDIRGNYVIAESALRLPRASVFLSDRTYITTPLRATDPLNPRLVSDRAVDGDERTYAEYAYNQRLDEKGRLLPNIVSIDIKASEPITARALTFFFGKDVQNPRTIAISTITGNGSEKTILARKSFRSSRVVFPEITAENFRVTLEYVDYLRITEMRFDTALSSTQTKVRNLIRFNATPDISYTIFYGATQDAHIEIGEAPILGSIGDAAMSVELMQTSNNPLYKQADSDDDGVVDADDNCQYVENADQVDLDGNQTGDACEDFDRDGVINAQDNCPEVVNRSQADSDDDGIGDNCDQQENRLLANYPWIPIATAMVVVVIIMFLIVKVLRDSNRKQGGSL